MIPQTCNLTGVPETMLWTLHNRASEAMRRDAWLRDPDAIRIYQSLEYDYQRSFGKPDSSHAIRSLVFDQALQPWLRDHPGATVVELACGLETQFQRCDDGRVQWLCIDVPESIAIRERFLAASERCRYLDRSALDPGWMDEVDARKGIFITAQGLLMYFEEAQVKELISAVFARFPEAILMFDTIPHWFSRMTVRPEGLWKTRHYRTPPMPWGIARKEITPFLRACSPRIDKVDILPYSRMRGFPACLFPWLSRIPGLANHTPCIVQTRANPTGKHATSDQDR